MSHQSNKSQNEYMREYYAKNKEHILELRKKKNKEKQEEAEKNKLLANQLIHNIDKLAIVTNELNLINRLKKRQEELSISYNSFLKEYENIRQEYELNNREISNLELIVQNKLLN